VLKARAVVIEDGPDIIDEQAVRRAERALDAIAHNFGHWMGEEVARLDEARLAARRRPQDEPLRAALYRRAHDIKGQGVTLGFPVAARAAASLCTLMDTVPWPAIDFRLVDQHVDAVLAIVREAGDRERQELGEQLALELETAVRLQTARHAAAESRVLH
jgi:chemotaxis protein histidine kinase CheA